MDGLRVPRYAVEISLLPTGALQRSCKIKEDELRSRSYLLAVEDSEFLQRDEMRALRFALEFSKIDLALAEIGIASTVVVFGSSRVISPEQAEEALKRLERPAVEPGQTAKASLGLVSGGPQLRADRL